MTLSLQIGMLVGNKYRVTKLLKTGAVAHAALVHSIEPPSSLDLVLRLSAGPRDTRLRKEGDILRRLSRFDRDNEVVGHAPEAAAFVDDGTHEGAYYLVTEYIPQDRYTTVVQAWEQGLGEHWIMPVCRAFVKFLSKVHRQDIEYYDIKSDHLYWSDEDNPKLRVIDFNLCKTHSKDESSKWQKEDLRSTAILVAQMLQKSQNWPECKFPLSLPPDWPSSLDVRDLPTSVSEYTRAVLAWLHDGFYADADAAGKDLEAIEHMDSQSVTEAITRRRSQAKELIEQTRSYIQDGDYDSALVNLRKAWTCLPFKRVSADPSNDPLACQAYLHILWLRYISQDEQMAGAFRSWLDGQYNAALDILAKSEHQDAPDALAWLEKRREIDDKQRAHWKKVAVIFKEGRHVDAKLECERYCQEYPEDTNAALWLDYFKKVIGFLDSHWWYDRVDRLYTMAMARLPDRLKRSQGDRLLYCWQQDEKLQEMCQHMRHSVEMTDVAWQMFGACAFGMAQVTFEYVKRVTVTAIELHATACGCSSDGGVSRAKKIIQGWCEQAQELANTGNQAHQQVCDEEFYIASEQYRELLDRSRTALDFYLKQQRPYWAPMIPSLPSSADAFPRADVMQLFQIAKESLDVFIDCENRLKLELKGLERYADNLRDELSKYKARIVELENESIIERLRHQVCTRFHSAIEEIEILILGVRK